MPLCAAPNVPALHDCCRTRRYREPSGKTGKRIGVAGGQ